MKKLILSAMLVLAAASAQASSDTSDVITCYKGNGSTSMLAGVDFYKARFTDFAISSDGYYRVRMTENNKLYLLPIANCYIALD